MRIKRLTILLLIASMVFSLLATVSIEEAQGAKYQYGYLISTPQAYIKRVSGDTYKVWGGGDPESKAVTIVKGRQSEHEISVRTLYNMKVKVTAGKWKNEEFQYTNKNYTGTWAMRQDQEDYLWFRSNGGTAYLNEGDTFENVVGYDIILSTGQIWGSPKNGAYGVFINPTDDQWADIERKTANGRQGTITIASVFEYKSVKPLDDPWDGGGGGGGGGDIDPPDPVDPPVDPPEINEIVRTVALPDTVTNNASVDAGDAVIGYKSLSGTLTAVGNMSATRKQHPNVGEKRLVRVEDHGSVIDYIYEKYVSDSSPVKYHGFNDFNVFGINHKDTGKDSLAAHGFSKEFTLTPDSFKTATGTGGWLQKRTNIQYTYELMATALTELRNGSRATFRTNDFGIITLNNVKPKATYSMVTMPGEFNGNQEVPSGYYYTNTPTKMSFTFSDSEDDIRNVYVAVGKKESMDNNMCELSFAMAAGDTEPTIFVRDDLFKINKVERNDLKGYVVEIEFLQPGQYQYMAYVNDANSNHELTNSDKITGGFLIRNGDGPEPPIAVITNPAYAFENELLKLTQNSTDPNGVDDIVWSDWIEDVVDVTAEYDPEKAAEPGYSDITGIKTTDNGVTDGAWYKQGGKVTFPEGASHHYFKVQLSVKDATSLTNTAEQIIKVISNVPVASITPEDGINIDALKENRKVNISAAGSLAPSSDPIDWSRTEWTFSKVEGDVVTPITDKNELAKIIQGGYIDSGVKPKGYTLQFYEPGVYEVGIKLHNKFSDENPGHEDTAASSTSIRITVVPDIVPISNVAVTSGKANFTENPSNFTVSFRVASYSDDGDKIIPVKSYSWKLYEDKNNDNVYDESEAIPDGSIRYNVDKTEVFYDVTFTPGMHNKVKAVVKTTEEFGEAFIEDLLYKAHGKDSKAWERSTEVSTVATVNWIPDGSIVPPPSDESLSKTPYLPTDIDGDTVNDGYFIRAYVDDFITIGTSITDEIPNTCKMTWELAKKNHNSTFDVNTANGTPWIQSGNVAHTLGLEGGTIKINSNGIYRLKMTMTDDMGDTHSDIVMIRVYPLPIGVLESNPDFLIRPNEPWTTKENIRFDLRANPTIVDDEWGVAWHEMRWSLDNWDVTPLNGQSIDEIHFMEVDWAKGAHEDQTPDDLTKYSGRNSQIGFGGTTDTLIDIVALPGLYGTKNPENPLELTDEAINKFYESAQKLADDIANSDPRYNVRFFKGQASETTLDTFVTEIPYGFFDGFNNTQADEYNLYTKSYSINWDNGGKINTETGVGTSGIAVLEPDISKMNETSGSGTEIKIAEDGYLTLIHGYMDIKGERPEGMPSEDTLKNMPFYGGVIVTAYNHATWKEQVLCKIDYGEFGTQSKNDLDNTKIAIFERIEDTEGNLTDEWKITGTVDNDDNGKYDYDPIIVSPDDPLTLTIHFKGYSGLEENIDPADQENNPWYMYKGIKGIGSDIPDSDKQVCGEYLAVGMRGWAGIYKTEQKNVTHPLSIVDTLSRIKYRPNATTIVLFATNDIINTPEINDLIALLDEEGKVGSTDHWVQESDYTRLIDYIKSNNLKFITMTVGDTINNINTGKSYEVIKELHNDLGQDYNVVLDGGKLSTMGYGLSSGNLTGSAATIIGLPVMEYIKSITTLVDNTQYRSCSFTEPGQYKITYWGTNKGNKTSLPVSYIINVIPDEDPIITADIGDKFYRDPKDGNNASIIITGPDSPFYGDVPTITSPDGDYIDRVVVTFKYDKENDRNFGNNKAVILSETTGRALTSDELKDTGLTYMYYTLKRLTR